MSGPVKVKLPMRDFGSQGARWEIASCELGPKRFAVLIVTSTTGQKIHLVLDWRPVLSICWGLARSLFLFRA